MPTFVQLVTVTATVSYLMIRRLFERLGRWTPIAARIPTTRTRSDIQR